MSAAIAFEGVSKTFRRGTARYRSLRDDLVALLTPWSWMRRHETFWALRDLSFAVPAGGTLGIIGPNGSGKSTTLKLIARITHPTTGTIRIRGRVGALIEIGAGIHPELTGRENIYMYGSIMGLRTQEIRKKFDSIVEFAGLGEFLDTPLKHYSSGMQVRLGFSVAAHMTTDILLVDEVLAVGDAAFQTKCLRRMRELRDEGVTILLVSHQLANIQRMCAETILLLEGKIAARGPTPEVISAYYQVLDTIAGQSPEGAVLSKGAGRSHRRDEVRILGVRLVDAAGTERPQFELGEDLKVVVEYEAARSVRRPNVSVSFNSSDWTVYTGADTKNDGFTIPQVTGRGAVELAVPQLGLGPGLYEVNVGIWDEEMLSPYDWKWGARRFIVNSARNLFAGRFVLPHAWALNDGAGIASQDTSDPPVASVVAAPALPSTEVLDGFQDSLHDALQWFLNGNFVVPGSSRLNLLRPLRLHSCRVPWDVFQAPVDTLDRLAKPVDNLRADSKRLVGLGQQRGWLVFGEAARLLSELYGVLDQLVESVGPGPAEEIPVLRRYDPKLYKERGLIAVERLAEYVQRLLTPYAKGFYLHGSLSTLDYTTYSDVDDFIIITRETALDPDALQRCATESLAASRFLYEHDPLHHHRHFIVTEIDLRRYAPAYLPPEVLRFATAVFGPGTLPIAGRDSSAAHRDILVRLAQGLSRWGKPGAAASNIWHLKSLVSWVLLLPVLYLETQGTYCYKKFSFELARPAFGAAWSAVDLASEIRGAWNYRPTSRERLLQRIVLDGLGNPALFEHVMAKWAQAVPQELQAVLMQGNFYQKVGELGQTALQLLAGPRRER